MVVMLLSTSDLGVNVMNFFLKDGLEITFTLWLANLSTIQFLEHRHFQTTATNVQVLLL